MASDGVEVARGIWHPPRSNAAMAASLLAEGARLSIRLEDGAIACRDDLKSVKVSDRIGSIPRRIGLSNGSLFETPDNDAIDRELARWDERRRSGPSAENMLRDARRAR